MAAFPSLSNAEWFVCRGGGCLSVAHEENSLYSQVGRWKLGCSWQMGLLEWQVKESAFILTLCWAVSAEQHGVAEKAYTQLLASPSFTQLCGRGHVPLPRCTSVPLPGEQNVPCRVVKIRDEWET